jgi:hypothetical protein
MLAYLFTTIAYALKILISLILGYLIPQTEGEFSKRFLLTPDRLRPAANVIKLFWGVIYALVYYTSMTGS